MDVSRASTATLGREVSLAPFRPNALPNVPEIDVPEIDVPEIDVPEIDVPDPEDVPDYLFEDIDFDTPSKRLIIAVDFGTTYSAVSYVALEKEESGDYLRLDRIQSIQDFPDVTTFGVWGNSMQSEVPTEVIYPLDRRFRKKEDLAAMEQEGEQVELGSDSDDLEESGSSTGLNGDDDGEIFHCRPCT